ncbi:hypothetical protein WR25_22498 [Diploscapter pachys]|uniref:Elongation of very long chain fatty acids protein n=1 Tax=Diploscapter pachys TaxID=2018661 RepID=A0A2A2JXW9_9BILA|nr:hypothetical protein WR25_22498 [Diploscapter pachys]
MKSTFLSLATRPFSFDYDEAKAYTDTVRWPAFLYSLAYVVVIFSIKAYMSQRKPYELTRALNFWNAWLAIFSTAGGIVTGLGLLNQIYQGGFVSSYTHAGGYFRGICGYFTWMFVMSKMAEFGDTILIVLRKKPLIFLHWYHHVLTMNYAIISYSCDMGFNSWIVWMNFSVHSIMYGYYMLRSMGIKVPAWVAQNITTMQLLQFLITLAILFHVWYLQATGVKVDSDTTMYWFCLIMELSYVALFANFYYHSYVKAGGKKYNAEKKPVKSE